MAITEGQRHQLYKRFEEVLGVSEANTVMALLPPVGWADVATKHDLDALEQRLDAKFEAIDERFEALEQRVTARLYAELNSQTRTFVTWMLGANATLGAAIIAAVKLT
ncbi:MAG: hypothetical protein ACRD29_05210 [Acidimicrobiales bacterium]